MLVLAKTNLVIFSSSLCVEGFPLRAGQDNPLTKAVLGQVGWRRSFLFWIDLIFVFEF
jgi:hypothetical protein